MLELTPSFFAIAAPAVVFAGVSKGGFGSGAAFASASILALVIEPGAAIGLMLPLLMLIDVANLRPYWKRWSWPESKLLILGAVPGVALGFALFRVADADVIRVLIGAFSVAFVIWHAGQKMGKIRPFARKLPAQIGLLSGAVAGFTSFVSHAGGPPAAFYLLSQRIDKTTYQACTVLVFWVINISKFIPYAFLGLFTYETAVADLILAPFAVFGAWLGVRAHKVVSEQAFFAVTYVLLSLTGAKLIWDGIV